MPLVLEIEYLTGVAYAARGPDSGAPDWPPQPDRVFSALVAAWAARGAAADERAALEWLERQPAPEIEAAPAAARPAPLSFVPPNDRLQRTANPAWRTRQPRRFPAALPQDPVVRLIWSEAEDAPLAALDAIGRDVAYLGHSASLTRCAFSTDTPAERMKPSEARRRIYPNRLKELEAAFQAGRRPSPGVAVSHRSRQPKPSANSFSADWLTFEIRLPDHVAEMEEDRRPARPLDLRAAAPACKALIKAVMSGYGQTLGGDAIPGWASGHMPDGAPARDAHLAAVPLSFSGFEHADGALLGFALVPPRGREDLLGDLGFRRALLAAGREPAWPGAPEDDADSTGRLRVWDKDIPGLRLDLALSLETEKRSLDPGRYIRASRRWATVTPMVLDRHLKPRARNDPGVNEKVQEEMDGLIREACLRSVGVEPTRAVAGKHSAVRGAPSAQPSGRGPGWTGWRVPKAFGSRPLVHAMIEFEEAVEGPLLIGAGRFCGLGLCLPLDPEPRE